MINEIFTRWETNRKSGFLCNAILTTYSIGKSVSESKLRYFSIIISIIHKFLCMLAGCSLPYKAEIAPSVLFPHGLYGVFISKGAQVKNGCIIFHQVTIGSSSLNSAKSPLICENVLIGAGAKIIGQIKVANGERIRAGHSIFHSIE
ncbi:hypothetical protein [Cobetia marina]|uniref:hypothetical protein n=1 Tax=Cobetia marina TaxID=28258 RepID=UPI003A913CD8